MSSRYLLAVFVAFGWLAGCATDEVETRGLPQAQASAAWPQKWAVNGAEPAAFAFGVTQPGPVTVQVQSQGAPVVVTLLGAAPQPVQQQAGAGTIRLAYQVTPADVKRGAFWRVRIALAQPGGAPAQASGTLAVQHAPADANAMRAEMQARTAQAPAVDPQAQAKAKAQMDAAFQAEMAQFEEQQAARRAAARAELEPHLQAARARMQQRIRTRGADEADIETRALVPDRGTTAISAAASERQRPPIQQQIILAPPNVQWLSRQRGQPGDPLLMTGTNFGERTGFSRVVFTLAGDPPRGGPVTVSAPIQEWRDELILVSVPDLSGIMGPRVVEIIVTRGTDGVTSQPQVPPLWFDPATEQRRLAMPPPLGESLVQAPAGWFSSTTSRPPGWAYNSSFDIWEVWSSQADWLGYKGNDVFFPNKRLLNGWKVAKTEILFNDPCFGNYGCQNHVSCGPYPYPGTLTGNAYVAESRIGTNQPYLNVRVWLDPYCSIRYIPTVWIQGPKGVAHE